MKKDVKLFVRMLSPRIVAKALVLLDKSTAVVVGACWLSAVAALILAALAVHAAVDVKKEAASAIVAEPVLPQVSTNGITPKDTQAVVERLQRQFPDLKIEIDSAQGIIVKTDDGSRFHQWITALSYVDTMAPQYRWNLKDFCVGKCGAELMRATVTGQRVAFSLPNR